MSESIERDGRMFRVRNLDEVPLTPDEAALQQQIDRRERTIDYRVNELLEGKSHLSGLPKAIQTSKGVSVMEKDIAREDVESLVRSARALAEQKPSNNLSL